MKRINTNSFKRLVKKRSLSSIIIIALALGVVWFTTESVGLMMLAFFLAGLFLLYQAFSGKKLRRQFVSAALASLIVLGILWVAYPDDRVLWREEVVDLEGSLDRLVSSVKDGVNQTGSDSAEQSEATRSSDLYQVDSVTDGDTIRVVIDGQIEAIRLIGIDTPEVYGGVECFGREASSRMKELVEGGRVSLEMDPTQGDRDRYDRLLRFVFTEDGQNVGEVMLREGFAREYTYNKPYKYSDEFIQAEMNAKELELGLWSPENC